MSRVDEDVEHSVAAVRQLPSGFVILVTRLNAFFILQQCRILPQKEIVAQMDYAILTAGKHAACKNVYAGPVICAGCTQRSKSCSLTKPSASAACFSVLPS